MRVMTFGTFDLLHDGHRFLLREAMLRGELTVIVARDHHVERIKGRLPAEREQVRAAHIAEEFPTADVRLGDARDFLRPIQDVQPDLILLGYDQRLPPGVTEEDLPCPVERLPAHHPDRFKSSLMRGERKIDYNE